MEKEYPVLYDNKKDCCGCGACVNICPKNAITLKEDEFGFLYPVLDQSICIKCYRCKQVCKFGEKVAKENNVGVYAVATKNENILKKSASGGVFATIARFVIEDGGVAVGACMDSNFNIFHTVVDNINEIEKLQGSKYVQSNIDSVYKNVKVYLDNGTKVLFSGTPCQVMGLHGYLGREYENLLTVDLICHGVPSNKMFKDYLKLLESEKKGKIEQFCFRDKSIGWGINGSAVVDGKTIKVLESESSYLYFFGKSKIYRDSCYNCRYANTDRVGDITLGDFWGIEKQHPDYIGKNKLNVTKGISVVIVSSEKGRKILEKVSPDVQLRESSIEKASAGNSQLRNPSSENGRKELLELYKEKGWEGIDRHFKKTLGVKRYSSRIKNMMPTWIKTKIKQLRK